MQDPEQDVDPLAPEIDTFVEPAAYMTADIPGVGGVLRERPEDFFVEELPLYEPCGSGEHIYLFVEKRNMSTVHMIRLLARHFGVNEDVVGYAGLKDKRAVTRQLISVQVPGKKPSDFPPFVHERVTVHWMDLHTNKLRQGHLAGNRFVVWIRGVEPTKAVHAHRYCSAWRPWACRTGRGSSGSGTWGTTTWWRATGFAGSIRRRWTNCWGRRGCGRSRRTTRAGCTRRGSTRRRWRSCRAAPRRSAGCSGR